MSMRYLTIPIGVMLALALPAAGNEFTIDWHTIDCGGGTGVAPGGVAIAGTIGQHDAGIGGTGGDYELAGGFWAGLSVGPVALQVAQIRVNGTLAQRSNILDIQVQFTTDTNIGDLIADGTIVQAVQLKMRGSGETVQLAADHYVWNSAAHLLTIDLTIDGTGPSNQTVLAEANYELQISVNMITSAHGDPLPDTDGTADGTYRYGDAPEHGLYRLAGDGTGDRIINALDLQLVRNSWLAQAGGPSYDANADMNSDGRINALDLQLVRNNWLASLTFADNHVRHGRFNDVERMPASSVSPAPGVRDTASGGNTSR